MMKLADLNNETSTVLQGFTKLKDFKDNEKIPVKGAGIDKGGKYGDSPYFITEDNKKLYIPHRYTDVIDRILQDDDAVSELTSGAKIQKITMALENGALTTTFKFI